MAFTVAQGFEGFCKQLRFSDNSQSIISKRYKAITKRVNFDFRGINSDTSYSLYVGSYGRDTEIRTSDIDVLVQLPYWVYEKFNNYSSNGQSALLQEVKRSIETTYPSTHLKADGQIISIPFSDGINFEVLPTFINNDKSYTFADTNNGGSWKITNPRAEIEAIQNKHVECNNNLKPLCKMARAWKDTNDVEISGILLDILAYNFISNWEYRTTSYGYYDWMSRDFFKYVYNQPTAQCKWKVMGSNRYIICLGNFQTKAKRAYENSLEAIENETKYPYTANKNWREIYGSKFPLL